MKLVLLLSLFAISSIFLLVNSFSQSRNNLYPAAAILLFIGAFLLAGTGLQIQEGVEYNYTQVDNETVIDHEKPVYKSVSNPTALEFSNLLGLLFMIMGSGYMVMAAPGRFKSLLSKR
jgi:hypothetical protein